MIRKAIIVVLALAAIGTVVLWFQVSAGPSIYWSGVTHWYGFGLLPSWPASPLFMHVYWDFAGFALDLRRFNAFGSGYLIVPFWAVFLLLSFWPTVVIVRGPIQLYRRHRLIIAIASFPLMVIVTHYVLTIICYTLWDNRDWIKMLGQYLGYEAVALAAFLTCPLGASYVVARTVFVRLGRSVDHNSHSCRKCGYNLTGNVSGICPECGSEVEQA